MDGPTPRWRGATVYCRCLTCHDHFDIVLYLRRIPGRLTRARLEPSTTAHTIDGMLYHRCGGVARAIDLSEPMALEPLWIEPLRDLEEAVAA